MAIENDGALYQPLRWTYGLVPLLAGLDKYFGLLADWESYIAPAIQSLLPVGPGTFMAVVGVIEIAVGVMVLTRWTRLGAYLAMLVPLTLARAAQAATRLTPAARGRAALDATATWRLSGLLILAGLQTAGVLVSGVRGALFGLGGGLAVMALLWLWRGTGRTRAWLLLCAVGAGLAGTAALNLPNQPLRDLSESRPYLERLGAIGDTSTNPDTAAQDRADAASLTTSSIVSTTASRAD